MTQDTTPSNSTDEYAAYLAALANRGSPDAPVSGVKKLARELVPEAARNRFRIAATDALRPIQKRRAKRLSATGPLRLHLGSGFYPLPGWLNVDLLGPSPDVALNLLRRLPFADGSADAVAHEHVIEHLRPTDALHVMRECHRVLAPGGLLRVAVPDLALAVERYAEAKDRRPRALVLNELFYDHGHAWMYDEELLAALFRAAGFGDPVRKGFRESDLTEVGDNPARRDESVYMEARK